VFSLASYVFISTRFNRVGPNSQSIPNRLYGFLRCNGWLAGLTGSLNDWNDGLGASCIGCVMRLPTKFSFKAEAYWLLVFAAPFLLGFLVMIALYLLRSLEK
jgi:hypothetical protein